MNVVCPFVLMHHSTNQNTPYGEAAEKCIPSDLSDHVINFIHKVHTILGVFRIRLAASWLQSVTSS